MRRLVALGASLALFLPAGGAARALGQPLFEFGRTGGNIVPFSVRIRANGTLAHSGPVELAHPDAQLSQSRLASLLRLARAERFWSLPRQTACSGALPDLASRFVTIHTATRTRTVTVRGECGARFTRVYRALSSAAGASG